MGGSGENEEGGLKGSGSLAQVLMPTFPFLRALPTPAWPSNPSRELQPGP